MKILGADIVNVRVLLIGDGIVRWLNLRVVEMYAG